MLMGCRHGLAKTRWMIGIVLGNLWVAALGNGKVFIPALAEAGISTPIVRTVSVLGATALYESALRSGTTASLTRPA